MPDPTHNPKAVGSNPAPAIETSKAPEHLARGPFVFLGFVPTLFRPRVGTRSSSPREGRLLRVVVRHHTDDHVGVEGDHRLRRAPVATAASMSSMVLVGPT